MADTKRHVREARIRKELDTLRAKPTKFKNRVAKKIRKADKPTAVMNRVIKNFSGSGDEFVDTMQRKNTELKAAKKRPLVSEEHKRGKRSLRTRLGG